jgi:hypothetical protein
MPSVEVVTTLLQWGIAGIFIYFLWYENRRLQEKVEGLESELSEQYRARLQERTRAEEHLWQIGRALATFAERERRRTDRDDAD